MLAPFSVWAQTGPTVHFHAWGGSAQVNSYLSWVSEQVAARHGITLKHVKLADTSDAVSRVLAEKAAGNHTRGSVDLIWINGENFAAMDRHDLLLSDWVASLPNFALTNPSANPAMVTDFGLPTRGQEAPWGKAALVFYYNARYVDSPPQSLPELLTFARRYPGRFTYPLPTDYLGVSFLKYALMSLHQGDHAVFNQPVSQINFDRLTAPLWAFLDALHPLMWRQGDYAVRQASELQRLMSGGDLLLAFSFTAAEIPSAVARFDLPPTIRTYAMQDGSLGNVHFIGIPYNTSVPDAAKTVVNFLLSPRAQAEKQKTAVWGDQTVLDLQLLSEAERAAFQPESPSPAALPADAFSAILPEPHASWTDALREAWFARYGQRL
ncbi:ABC transporter substrate-binding protein [Alteromonas halophila]|uniref:ABC transporter substrate-binding protein n=1 Tax=Alteromonas halophila TaxID=516698 RepID=A0A918JGD0_9ALTE|nr:ABC transporter substrate-binding protein [Alteromonas halophila]GGW77825.1 ABC transporter substrate-binding protein [Alteromonas halophila]